MLLHKNVLFKLMHDEHMFWPFTEKENTHITITISSNIFSFEIVDLVICIKFHFSINNLCIKDLFSILFLLYAIIIKINFHKKSIHKFS